MDRLCGDQTKATAERFSTIPIDVIIKQSTKLIICMVLLLVINLYYYIA